MMALQGFHFDECILDNYSSTFLQDLAGNSFNVANAAVFIVLSITGLAVVRHDAEEKPFRFNPAVETDTESESEF